jgi:hypothetical protein
MTTVISRSRLTKLQARKQKAALVRYFYTGEWSSPPILFLRPARTSFSSSTPLTSLVSNLAR